MATELILAALAAGASAGASNTATAAVQDAYNGLKSLLRRRIASHGDQAELLDLGAAESDQWRDRLGAELVRSGAERDHEILDAAQQLLTLVEGETVYRIDASQARGVQIGTANSQTNHFR